jgi:hypothetical protein
MPVRCAWCHDDLAVERHVRCPGCATLVHASCWDGRCFTPGCARPAGAVRKPGRWRPGLGTFALVVCALGAGRIFYDSRPKRDPDRPAWTNPRDVLMDLPWDGQALHAGWPFTAPVTGVDPDDDRLPACIQAFGPRGITRLPHALLIHSDAGLLILPTVPDRGGQRWTGPDERSVWLYSGTLLVGADPRPIAHLRSFVGEGMRSY